MLDDSPLAVYDAEFGDEDSPTSELTDEYSAPACFSSDLFALANCNIENDVGYDTDTDTDDDGEESESENGKNPPWRWILIGPERSGTGLHVDPLFTEAWVTVLQGRKRWMLFPPDTPRDAIGMMQDNTDTDDVDEGETNTSETVPVTTTSTLKDVNVSHQIASVIWFRDYYDLVTSPQWPERYRPVEVLQNPGETVFVPNGWPHLVLNLELTVAITHNYASEWGSEARVGLEGEAMGRIWKEVAEKEPEFGRRWYRGMKVNRMDLAERVRRYHEGARLRGESWALDMGLDDVKEDV